MSFEMNYSVIILILTGAVCTSAEIHHEIHFIYGCFESSDPAVGLEIDGDEVVYGDFNKNSNTCLIADVVFTLPKFISITPEDKEKACEYATISRVWCKNCVAWGKQSEPRIPKNKDAPESTIYPRDEVELGVENTLICFVNDFFPPPVKVNWTKNGMEVTEGLSLSRYYPNKDGTFHQFSRLSFTPQKEDVYICAVAHTALKDPKTREYKVSGSSAGPGPAVFCRVGLTLGLLGVATGIFFIYKGKRATESQEKRWEVRHWTREI
ncbi:H-2 class II histocompatibility antigen, A-Q alpha chain-like [Salvelinus alpinus]|uniref:H-2 class II histocompatibility antigen, A-Q alpha chain-like n=1 Tax=Salvelinus alpinus TaxID=8036 RepID=UPI0039FD3FB6